MTRRVSKEFYALWRDPKVEDFDAENFYMTFDNCLVKQKKFDKVIENLKKFDLILNRENHFRSIIIELEKLKDSDITGVGFIWTSVAGGIWDCPNAKDGTIANISTLVENEDYLFLYDETFFKERNIKDSTSKD